MDNVDLPSLIDFVATAGAPMAVVLLWLFMTERKKRDTETEQNHKELVDIIRENHRVITEFTNAIRK